MLADCLDTIRVLDFSHVVAGPVCGMLLADMGANVVKIESPQGEMGRKIGPPWLHGESVVVLSVNRNKQGLAIDLKTAQGQQVAQAMAARADIVIESFRPGVMKRFGLDYDSLKAANPKLVYCSISAYGQTGPWRDRPGVDGIIQAVAGLMNTLGEAGSGPVKVSVPIADMVTGYLATVAVLGALNKVRAGHDGQHVDVSLYNATLMLQQVGLSFYLATGEEPDKIGSAAPYAAPNEAFPTLDGWIMVAAYQQERWMALCDVLLLPHLATDPRFAANAARVANRAALQELLGAEFGKRSTDAWLEALSRRDILCAPIASYRDVTHSAQYRHNRIESTSEHPVAGPVRVPGFAIDGCEPRLHPVRPAPTVGQHSVEVLKRYGLPAVDIERLVDAGIVATRSLPAESLG